MEIQRDESHPGRRGHLVSRSFPTRRHNRRPTSPDRVVERKTYTVTEVSVILGIGRSTAYELVQRGEIAAIHMGGRVVVACAEVYRLLGEHPAA